MVIKLGLIGYHNVVLVAACSRTYGYKKKRGAVLAVRSHVLRPSLPAQ